MPVSVRVCYLHCKFQYVMIKSKLKTSKENREMKKEKKIMMMLVNKTKSKPYFVISVNIYNSTAQQHVHCTHSCKRPALTFIHSIAFSATHKIKHINKFILWIYTVVWNDKIWSKSMTNRYCFLYILRYKINVQYDTTQGIKWKCQSMNCTRIDTQKKYKIHIISGLWNCFIASFVIERWDIHNMGKLSNFTSG